MEELVNGIKSWKNSEGYLHREGGPAVIHPSGRQEWWYNGMRHNSKGPAILCSDYSKWFMYDKLHRTDGPAVENRLTGVEEWWIDGKRV
jgi:hypothetical protein